MATIDPKRNKNGELIGYRFRACVGRDTRGKQIWRTTSIDRPEGLTPKREENQVARLADAWEQEQRAEYERSQTAKNEKDKITFEDFVNNHWWTDHVQDGKHSPNSIAFFRATSKSSVEFFGKKKLSEITPEMVKRYLNYLNKEARTEIIEEKDIEFNIKINKNNEAVLSWDERKSALSYKVYRKGQRAKQYTRIANIKKLSFTDSKRTPSYGYEYIVKEVVKGRGDPYSQTSKMHHFGTLRNIMEYAYRIEYIKEDPCQKMGKNEVPKRGKHEIDFLNPGEAQQFLSCVDKEYAEAVQKYEDAGKLAKQEAIENGLDPNKADNPEIGTLCRASLWRCYLYLLITTGLRRGEAVGLQWGDINHDKLTLSISRSVAIDKTSKTKQLIKDTKTGENRIVALLQPVYDMLIEYSGVYQAYFRIEKIKPSFYIFSTEADPAQPIHVTTPTRKIQKFVKRNGLPDVSPHDLRHTAASLALESGAGIKEISELMGHSDIGTTSKFYAALTQEAKRRTVEGIGSVLFGKQDTDTH